MLATGAAALCSVPLVYLTIRVLSGGPAAIERWLLRQRTVELTVTTVALAAAVIIGSLLLGVATAWATTRVRLPAARLWLVVAALPLAVPSYVSAFAWVATIPGLNGFWPLVMIMVLACTPYVTLPVAAALRMADQRQSDAARTLGSSPARVFRTVSLPQLVAGRGGRRAVGRPLHDRRLRGAGDAAGAGDDLGGPRVLPGLVRPQRRRGAGPGAGGCWPCC